MSFKFNDNLNKIGPNDSIRALLRSIKINILYAFNLI